MKLNGKTVNMVQLADELRTAGIDVPSLGAAGDDIHTYDAGGVIVDLPPESAAVIAVHEPAHPVPTRNAILLSLLDGLEPGDEATEVMLLVQQEMLRP